MALEHLPSVSEKERNHSAASRAGNSAASALFTYSGSIRGASERAGKGWLAGEGSRGNNIGWAAALFASPVDISHSRALCRLSHYTPWLPSDANCEEERPSGVERGNCCATSTPNGVDAWRRMKFSNSLQQLVE